LEERTTNSDRIRAYGEKRNSAARDVPYTKRKRGKIRLSNGDFEEKREQRDFAGRRKVRVFVRLWNPNEREEKSC